MTERVDLYDSTYRHFAHPVLNAIRKETFGEDIGQNSWVTVDEYDRLLAGLEIAPGETVLEVASGAGGPAIHVASVLGCRIVGVDRNEHGVTAATRMAEEAGVADRVQFQVADANARLPFADASFDGLICMDSMNHLLDRARVLREWHRVLRPGRRALFTDPVVLTGPVTNAELAERASIGSFLFVPPGVNERLLEQAGFELVWHEDVSEAAARVAARRRKARESHRVALVELEGEERFAGLQRFLAAVHALTSEHRLSRIAYLAEKPA
jgi:SAM-dependent methyltransferase